MASELGKAYVQIMPSAQGIKGSITKVLSGEATSAGDKAGATASKSFGSKFSSLSGKFIKAGAIASAVSVPLIAGIKKAMDAYSVQNEAETKLIEIYKTRMGVGKKAAKSTFDLASALQKQGIIGDEVAISGAQQLATFAKYPKTVNTLLPAMNNLLAQQKGVNATTGDAVNIGNLMGKVMQGQTGALKRVGISFTSAQEQVLKYGTEQERAAMLAEVITSNVGNMNEALAQTPSGKIQQLKNSLGDLWEGIGASLAPALASVASFLSERIVPVLERVVNFMVAHPLIGKIALGLTGILAIGGPLLIMVGAIISAVTVITPLIAGIGVAIAAVIAIGVVLIANWNKIKKVVVANWNSLKAQAKAVFNGIRSTVTTITNGIRTKITSAWNAIKTKTTSIWNGIKTAITSPFKTAYNTVMGWVNKIKSIFPFKLGNIATLKIPRIKVDGGKAPWGIGGKGRKPNFDITWAAKGLIANSPQLIGIGDVKGGEAAVPLTPFWNRLDAWGDSLVTGMNTIASAGASNSGVQEIVLYAFPNGPEMYRTVVNTYDKGKKRLG